MAKKVPNTSKIVLDKHTAAIMTLQKPSDNMKILEGKVMEICYTNNNVI